MLALLVGMPTPWAQETGIPQYQRTKTVETETKKLTDAPKPKTPVPQAKAVVEPPKNDVRKTDKSGLTIKVSSSTGIYFTDNADFRALDESSDRAVIDTDDRHLFGHSDVRADLTYVADRFIHYNASFQYDLPWKDDQLGRNSGSKGALGVYALNVGYTAIKKNGYELSFRFGRQPFQIGGVPRDYMLSGTLDAVTSTVDMGGAGRIRVLGVDFFGGNALPESGYRYYRDGRETTYNLRGETNTLRTGAVYELDQDATQLPLDFKGYYFYATIGGGPIEESGSDITFGGALGNYRDADYQHLMGTRLAYAKTHGKLDVNVFGEFARSMGIDRKPPTERDVKTDGNAYGGGAAVAHSGFSIFVNWYHFDGGQYASDGLEFERGFVGFKGARIGGNTVGRFLSWKPSSHVGAAGVVNAPQDQSRVAGTEFLHAGLGLQQSKVKVSVDWWLLKDTTDSFLNVSRLDEIGRPTFGHTRAEFAAQERFGGKSLGQAIDVSLTVDATDNLDFIGGGGVFLPGDYYDIEVERVAGNQDTALGGQEAFIAAWLGVQVGF